MPQLHFPLIYFVVAIVFSTALISGCTSPEERAARYIEQADSYLAEGDYEKAGIEARNAAQIEPKNPRARFILAMVAKEQGDARSMVNHLLIAIDSDPTFAAARVELGRLMFFSGLYDEAAEQADQAIADSPDDVDALVLHALVAMENGRTETALADLDRALAQAPDNVDALLTKATVLARTDVTGATDFLEDQLDGLDEPTRRRLRELRIALFIEAGQRTDAEAEYATLIAEYPDDATIRFKLAGLYEEADQVDAAERTLREAVELDPDNVQARMGYAVFLEQSKDFAAAEAALTEFARQSPDSLTYPLALGRLYESNEYYDQAVQEYQKLANEGLSSNQAMQAQLGKIRIAIKTGETDQAASLLEETLQQVPDNSEALTMRAGLAFIEKRYDDAIADLRIAIRKNPDSTAASMLLARTYVQAKEGVLAEDMYRQILELDPGNVDAKREMAALALVGGDFDEAQVLLQESLTLKPDDIDSAKKLIELQLDRGEYEAAEAQARMLLTDPQNEGAGALALGRILEAQGQFDGAADAYRQAGDGSPAYRAMALERLSKLIVKTQGPQAAIAELRNQRARKPEDFSAEFLLGQLYAATGDTPRAIESLETVIDKRPNFIQAYEALAAVYPDDLDAQVEILQKALESNPGNDRAATKIGLALKQQGRYADIIEMYESAFDANRSSTILRNNLASALLKYGDGEASDRRALELAAPFSRSEDPILLDTLGWAELKAGDPLKAVRYLESAVSKNTEDPELRYHLGMAYVAQQDKTSARQELSRAVNAPEANFFGIEEARATLEELEAG